MDTNERLIRAVEQASRKLASSGQIDALLHDVLGICVEEVGAAGGTIYIHDEAQKRLVFRHVLPAEVREKLPERFIPDDYGVAGRVFQERRIEITSEEDEGHEQPTAIEEATGIIARTMITVPLNMEGEQPVGVVQLINKRDGRFTNTDAAVLDTIAAISTMAILNSKLTEEAARASTLLGMGKVSHDIGNLAASLYANISFSELAVTGLKSMLESCDAKEATKVYAESLSETLRELKTTVDRIVGYSRLVSDLSSGRPIRPDWKLGPIAETVETSAAYLESEAKKAGVTLTIDVQPDAPPLLHDELFVYRIVQNLVGNAIKAVHDTQPESAAKAVGRAIGSRPDAVCVRYRFVDSQHVIEVSDTGPGISKEMADQILSGSVRSAWAKGEGSGWGLRIVRELAYTLDAKLEFDSEPGCGTTVRVAIPHRSEVPAE